MISKYKKYNENIDYFENCVTIGGVGGSGTRLVAELVRLIGFHIGYNLNASSDNLSFPNLKNLVYGSTGSIHNRNLKIYEAINNYISALKYEYKSNKNKLYGWGWKVPGTFYYLNYFNKVIPNIKYIHVIRNGLDMAYSSNQNQLKNWGPLFNINYQESSIHKDSLDYWLHANNMALSNGMKLSNSKFYIIKFEELCNNPKNEIINLLKFLDVNQLSNEFIKSLVGRVNPPISIGRYLKYNFNTVFTKSQLIQVDNIYNKIKTYKRNQYND